MAAVVNKNGKTLFDEAISLLELPFIKRNTVATLQNVCQREGMEITGGKNALVERIYEVAQKEKQLVAQLDHLESAQASAQEVSEAPPELLPKKAFFL